MPKVDKPSKAAGARQAAHPTAISKTASSKKKKKSTATAGHSASLIDEMEKLANPGKLKPVKAAPAAKKKNSAQREESKLENQLLLAGKHVGAAKKAQAQLYGEGTDDAAMDDDEGGPDFGESEEDEGEEGADDAAQIPARMSKKILQQVHAQQREELDGEGVEEEQSGANSSARRLRQHISLQPGNGGDSDMEDPDDDGDDDDFGLDEAGGRSGGMREQLEDEVELSLEDQQSLDMFMPSANTVKGKSLADIILDKIKEKEAAAAGNGAPSHGSNVHFGAGFGAASAFGVPADAAEAVRSKLDPKIVEVYTKVGKFLSHYTSGKIPKAFKVIPNLKSWEEVLFLTTPDSWSCQAHLVATRIFASNFNPKMAQRFYALVLLPKVRNDIESNKHLNFHLYQAIKKALYKPAAFFKGLLLPLAEEGATAREAVIMSSILAKCTIPVLHSSVALLKLTQMPFSGTCALFIKTLLNKKYSLPVKVLAACVQYFCAFLHHSTGGSAVGAMPLIWHQTLLCFVQRYKYELTVNQIAALRNLVKVQQHHAVTNEIRRELLAVAAGPQQQQQIAGVGSFQFIDSSKQGAATPAFTSLAASLAAPQSFSMDS